MNKALLAGISTYPGLLLPGALNDVTDMQEFLVNYCGFKNEEIRLLTNGRATKQEMLQGLQWLVAGLKPGDRVLFQFSGHGLQIPAGRNNLLPHGMDEAICPYDFEWGGKNTIRDKEFIQIFSGVPQGVSFVWVTDCCHAGDMSDAYERGQKATTGFSTQTGAINFVLLAACGSYQQAAGIIVNGRANGAFTYFLLQELMGASGLYMPLNQVMPHVHQQLARLRYSQVPQLEGCGILKSKPFLSR